MPRKTIKPEIRTLDKETGEIITTPAVTEWVPEPRGPIYWKTQWNHDTLAESLRLGTINNLPSLTEQAPKDQVDINHILAKFGIANVLATRPASGNFLDVPDDLDLRSAIHQIRDGQTAFNNLPKNIRDHFETLDNYVDYIDQAMARKDEKALQDIGVLPRPPVKPPEMPQGNPAVTTPPGGSSSTPPATQGAPNAPQT